MTDIDPKPETESGATVLDKMKTVVENALTLQVVTLVADINVDADGKTSPASGNYNMGCSTSVNMLAGDITNLIGSGLQGADRESLMAFHATQVEKGQQVIQGTVDMLKDVAGMLSSAVTGVVADETDDAGK